MVKGAGKIIDNIAGGSVPENYWQMKQLRDNKIEEVYCHANIPDENGYGYVGVINDELSLGCYLK